MSYSIVYAREFIKTNDGRIIPLVLSGCNNCWEMYFNHERRERSWFPCLIPHKTLPAVTPEVLMAMVKSRVPSSDNQHFMRNGKFVDDKAFVRFFENGIKKALTIEELIAQSYEITFLQGFVVSREKEYFKATIQNSDELDEFLNLIDKFISEHEGEKFEIILCYNYPNPIKRKLVNRRKKAVLEEKYYVVKMADNYVTQLTRMSLKCSPYVSAAKRFATERLAWKWIKDRELERRYSKFKFDVEYVA